MENKYRLTNEQIALLKVAGLPSNLKIIISNTFKLKFTPERCEDIEITIHPRDIKIITTAHALIDEKKEFCIDKNTEIIMRINLVAIVQQDLLIKMKIPKNITLLIFRDGKWYISSKTANNLFARAEKVENVSFTLIK